MPAISFITTCKGRLAHLQDTLPTWAAQPDSECIVVDYDCPDGTAAWVQENYPAVTVVKVNHAPLFQKPQAQNLGAAQATAPWLCFLDADVRLGDTFAKQLIPRLAAGTYQRPDPITLGTYGSVVCTRRDFDRIEGFDEAIQGCSYMDDDFYVRLQMAALTPTHFAGELVIACQHDDELRTRHYEIKERAINHQINFLYCNIKHDLMRHASGSNLPLAIRRNIYAEVKKQVLHHYATGSDRVRMEIHLPAESTVPVRYSWQIQRTWTFDLGKR